MVADPYKVLGLPHSADNDQIKRAYRELARRYHPDRFVNRSQLEKDCASDDFAKIAAAYALLTDPQRKQQYDHIYKYGGYDDEEEEKKTDSFTSPQTPSQQSQARSNSCRKRDRGIGYTCIDPLAFLYTNGRVKSKMAMAGLHIPERVMQHPTGVRFAFASTKLSTSPQGTKQFQCQTTQYADGKRYTRTETTTIHQDGRKEVVIEGNDFVERRVEPPSEDFVPTSSTTQPWYASAWHGIKDKLMMCYNPCPVVG